MPVPDTLPQELVPPSARDLEDTVSQVKTILDLMPPRATSPSSVGQPGSRMRDRSFMGNSSANLDRSRDATVYTHNDSEPPGGFYKPRSRHVDRDAVRAREDDDSPSSDLSDMKRQLANTASRLDRDADERSRRTQEDEELDQEMDDLKYRVKRVQDDLDYNSRGPKTVSKEEERRRLERELLNIMHERIPEVERKIKARDERKEKEKRQWARERDRANDRFGRYDSKDSYLSSPRDEDRDRPYSRSSDRDRPYSRGAYDRDDRDRDRDRERDRERDRDRDYSSRRPLSPLSREVDYGRTRSPPPAARSPPPPPPAAAPPSLIRDPPPAPAPTSTPTPSLRNMTPAERQAFAKAEAQRRIQERMAKLGVVAPSSSPTLDTSVEDRLAQEKKEAGEKARIAEKQAEEREQARKERLASEKALRDEVSPPPKPTPTPTATAAAPVPTPKAATPKAAPPPPPAKRAPAPPPPRRGGAVAAPARPAPVVSPPKPVAPPAKPAVDEEAAERARQEEMLRAREAALRKAKEDREAAFQERLRQLEKEEEEAAKLEEQLYQERAAALKAKRTPTASPAMETPPAAPPARPTPAVPAVASAVSTPPVATPAEKSTNPFSRLINQGATAAPAAPPPAAANGNGSTNPWAAKPTSPPVSTPAPSKSPAPTSGKPKYPTAPSEDDSDWGDVKDNDVDESDSSDDEITSSRAVRANIAQTLFGNMMPRPTSAAAVSVPSSPATPGPGAAAGGDAPPPPPPPPAVRAPVVVKAEATPDDRNALLQSIQGGMKLRKAVTVDKSGPPLSGKVLGDTAPPAHINAAPRPISPPVVRVTPPPMEQFDVAEAPSMTHEDMSRANNRQSVGWFADRAADVGSGSPAEVHRLPAMLEADEEEERFVTPPAAVPEITVNEPVAEPVSDLMADIDKSTRMSLGFFAKLRCVSHPFFLFVAEHRVRSLYAFQGDGPEDLCKSKHHILLCYADSNTSSKPSARTLSS